MIFDRIGLRRFTPLRRSPRGTTRASVQAFFLTVAVFACQPASPATTRMSWPQYGLELRPDHGWRNLVDVDLGLPNCHQLAVLSSQNEDALIFLAVTPNARCLETEDLPIALDLPGFVSAGFEVHNEIQFYTAKRTLNSSPWPQGHCGAFVLSSQSIGLLFVAAPANPMSDSQLASTWSKAARWVSGTAARANCRATERSFPSFGFAITPNPAWLEVAPTARAYRDIDTAIVSYQTYWGSLTGTAAIQDVYWYEGITVGVKEADAEFVRTWEETLMRVDNGSDEHGQTKVHGHEAFWLQQGLGEHFLGVDILVRRGPSSFLVFQAVCPKERISICTRLLWRTVESIRLL